MTDLHHTLGGRLALLRPDALSESQRAFYDSIQANEIGRAKEIGFQAETTDQELIGPFNAMLRSPEVAAAFVGATHAIIQYSALSAAVQQVIILTVGAVWKAPYELYAHSAVARKVGLKEEAIQALAAGQRPVGLAEEETLAHDFTRSLVVGYQVDSDLYRRAIEAFGEPDVFNMIALAGQYMAVSALLKAFKVPAPVETKEGGEKNSPPAA